MSISFDHPSNTVNSTDTISFVVQGGTVSVPRTIKFNANSIVVPVKQLPQGESGAVVFDSSSRTLKYHNGSAWIELLSKSEILADVNNQLTLINSKLNTKVDSVVYSTSSVPAASISGTTLNIVFPNSSSGPSTNEGLFTSTRPGSIMQYALISGQTIASIREQMGGAIGSQNGRNGTSGSPYITKDGWCFADGNYWTWIGPNNTITKQVPNLNQAAYLKGLTSGGITKTDSVVSGSGSVNNTTITLPAHYHGVGMMDGISDVYADDGLFIFGKQWNDGKTYQGVAIFGDDQRRYTKTINGSNTQTALSTTDPIYYSGTTNTITHSHTLTNVDVPHFNVAMLYNIAEPETAISLEYANTLYVKKAGDSMAGPLNVLTPTANMHAATKLYVDNAINGINEFVQKTGDTMLGPLTVLTPTANMHAATKKYVDDNLSGSSSYVKDVVYYGNPTISGDFSAGTPINYLTITIPPENYARKLFISPCPAYISLRPDGDVGSPRSAYIQVLLNGTSISRTDTEIPGSTFTSLLPANITNVTLAANQTHTLVFRASCTERTFKYAKVLNTDIFSYDGPYPIPIEIWKENSSGISISF